MLKEGERFLDIGAGWGGLLLWAALFSLSLHLTQWCDARRDVEADDRDLLEMLNQPSSANRAALGTMLVATKLDEVPKNQRMTRLRDLERQANQKVIGLSALEQKLVASLWLNLCREWLSQPEQESLGA